MKTKIAAVAVAGLILFGCVAKAAILFQAMISTAGVHGGAL